MFFKKIGEEIHKFKLRKKLQMSKCLVFKHSLHDLFHMFRLHNIVNAPVWKHLVAVLLYDHAGIMPAEPKCIA